MWPLFIKKRISVFVVNKFQSICDNRVFRRLYAKGKVFVGKTVVTYTGFSNHGEIRVGITAGKKVGNAVLRNRSRRVIREAFRPLSSHVKKGVNIVFVARGKTPYLKSYEIMAEMKQHLKKAGILEDE